MVEALLRSKVTPGSARIYPYLRNHITLFLQKSMGAVSVSTLSTLSTSPRSVDTVDTVDTVDSCVSDYASQQCRDA